MITRLGALGDIHAQSDLLASALALFEAHGCDGIVSVGDIIDGLAPPGGGVNACCRLLQQHRVLTVAGNHERWLLAGEMRTLPHATQLAELDAPALEFLGALPPTRLIDTAAGPLLLCHGIDRDDMAQLRPYDEGYALECIDALPALLARSELRFVLGGHTHYRMLRRIQNIVFLNAGTLLCHHDTRPTCLIVDFAAKTGTFFVHDGRAWSPASETPAPLAGDAPG